MDADRTERIDFVQWRALVRAYVWIDYAALFGAFGRREARRTAVRLAAAWTFLTFLGLGLAALVWLSTDPFFAAVSVVTTMMFWSGIIVIGQPAGLAAPDDHDIVGFRPVNSGTLFAVRATALLVPCIETTVLAGWLPVVAFATRGGGSIATAAAAALAITASSMFVTLAVVSLYAWLIRIVPPARLTRMLSYGGAVAGLVLAAAIMLGTNHIAESDDPAAVFDVSVRRDLQTMWFPGAWFATYVVVVEGSASRSDVAAAVLSIAALAALGIGLRGRLSSDYAARISDYATQPAVRARRRKTWTALRDERRAVALLIASHLRGDVRFQLAVASNLTMGLLFTIMSSSFRKLPEDPFVTGGDIGGLMAPLMALFFVPSQIYQSLIVSTSHEASWMYFSAPAHRVAVLTGARDTIAALIFAPAFVLLTMFYSFAFGHVPHAVLQVILLGLLGFAAFQGNILVVPRLPFSVPMAGTRGGGPAFVAPLVVMVIGAPVFVGFQLVAYRSWIHTTAGFAVLVLVNLALAWALRQRVARNPTLLAYSSC